MEEIKKFAKNNEREKEIRINKRENPEKME